MYLQITNTDTTSDAELSEEEQDTLNKVNSF